MRARMTLAVVVVGLVSLVSNVGGVAGAARAPIVTPTSAEVALLTSDLNAFSAANAITNAGVSKTLSDDLAAVSSALAHGNSKGATNAMQQFISDVNSQAGKHISAPAATALAAIATTGAAPATVTGTNP